MERHYSDDVIYLSELSGFSERKCSSVLGEAHGDVSLAEKRLLSMGKKTGEKARDTLSSWVLMEKGKRIYIMSGEERLIAFPYMLVVGVLLAVSVTSRVIGIVLFAFFLFGMDIRTETVGKRGDEVGSRVHSKRMEMASPPKGTDPEPGSDSAEFDEFTVK